MTNTTAAPVRGLRHSPDFHDLGRLISLMTGAEKHAPAAHSTMDALWVLYDRVLRVTPATADDPGRDRFLLSKGHGPMAYYAVLAAHGFFGEDVLGFGTYGSPLGHRPDVSPSEAKILPATRKVGCPDASFSVVSGRDSAAERTSAAVMVVVALLRGLLGLLGLLAVIPALRSGGPRRPLPGFDRNARD
ncbi:hypothetical protein SMICM304S_11379 [Streptomyces microflavus]